MDKISVSLSPLDPNIIAVVDLDELGAAATRGLDPPPHAVAAVRRAMMRGGVLPPSTRNACALRK